jgi:hypothetical protein
LWLVELLASGGRGRGKRKKKKKSGVFELPFPRNSPFRETPQEKNQEKNVFGVGWFLGS